MCVCACMCVIPYLHVHMVMYAFIMCVGMLYVHMVVAHPMPSLLKCKTRSLAKQRKATAKVMNSSSGRPFCSNSSQLLAWKSEHTQFSVSDTWCICCMYIYIRICSKGGLCTSLVRDLLVEILSGKTLWKTQRNLKKSFCTCVGVYWEINVCL